MAKFMTALLFGTLMAVSPLSLASAGPPVALPSEPSGDNDDKNDSKNPLCQDAGGSYDC